MHLISRRKFVALTATSVASAPLASMARTIKGSVTAQEIFDRIRKNVGVEWKPDTVDTFKAGDAATAVTGIVTTALASLNVLNAAVKAGANMIVTCEPTFFSKADSPTPPVRRIPGMPQNEASSAPPPADPVFTAKAEFLKKHNLVVLRLSDHWRLRKPDPFAQGLATDLGWSKFITSGDPAHLTIPETSLDALASHVKRSLKSRGGMRIVGNQSLRIRKVAFLPGSTPIQAAIQTLPEVDTIIAGEVREWETVEYVRDTVALGGKKSLILVGRVVSEDPGMQACAQWLKTIVPEVSSTWISAGDPYWRPTL
ncbi:Nif3-like dinuclear metal center hexameric protein [Terriglobus albidus]|uniref:Nif3-like dinuclear metal center hexameric protein n=1 Tax=Terriglobus albidus TaxID=1592106 RepID=UPI0021E028AE|nr:Nif3-like dinuclear metal center hexameric protein [Terriglobus albidus]